MHWWSWHFLQKCLKLQFLLNGPNLLHLFWVGSMVQEPLLFPFVLILFFIIYFDFLFQFNNFKSKQIIKNPKHWNLKILCMFQVLYPASKRLKSCKAFVCIKRLVLAYFGKIFMEIKSWSMTIIEKDSRRICKPNSTSGI